MPQSLSAIYVHAVFSTKLRQPFLKDVSLRNDAHSFIAAVSTRLGCPCVEIGGYTDHVHVLARFGKAVTVSEWIKETKRVSSLHISKSVPGFAWQAGYGVFGVDSRGIEGLRTYIRGQEEHHRNDSFQDELRRLMTENGLEWDERYFWD